MILPKLNPKSRADYSKGSRSRTFPVEGTPWGTIWIRPDLLRQGNRKLHQIYTFDLSPIRCCINTVSCESTCYALKSDRLYPDVFNSRLINSFLAWHDPDTLRALLWESLYKLPKGSVIRPHASGDFFKPHYADLWCDLMTEFTDHTFYTYTKAPNWPSIGRIDDLHNINLIRSDGPLGGRNFGPLNRVLDFVYLNKGWAICPATLQPGIKCNLDCSYCLIKGNCRILFVQH